MRANETLFTRQGKFFFVCYLDNASKLLAHTHTRKKPLAYPEISAYVRYGAKTHNPHRIPSCIVFAKILHTLLKSDISNYLNTGPSHVEI